MFFDFFFVLFFLLFIVMLLGFLLLIWVYWSELLSSSMQRETVDVYECGFDSKDMSRLPFSLRFFLMMMFFMLLDMEVCLLLQFPYEYMESFYGKRFWFWVFLVILMVGVMEELRRGFLSWKK